MAELIKEALGVIPEITFTGCLNGGIAHLIPRVARISSCRWEGELGASSFPATNRSIRLHSFLAEMRLG